MLVKQYIGGNKVENKIFSLTIILRQQFIDAGIIWKGILDIDSLEFVSRMFQNFYSNFYQINTQTDRA